MGLREDGSRADSGVASTGNAEGQDRACSETHCSPPPICKASSLVNPSTETGSQFTEDRSSSHKHITLLRHQPGLKEVHLPHSTAITHLINSNFVSFFKFMGTLRRIFPWARSMERAT